MTASIDVGKTSSSSARGTSQSNGRNLSSAAAAAAAPLSSSYRQNGGHKLQPLQTDPLIESLDEVEEVEVWLNKVVASHKLLNRDATSSALQLRGVDGNATISTSTSSSWAASTSFEGYLSSLSSTLSFARQDTTDVIDGTISEVNTTMPRLGLELRLMKDAALTLKGNIDKLQKVSHPEYFQDGNLSAASSSQNASAALERLSALSALHTRMSSARNVLSLAEAWSTLAADVTSHLNEAKLSRASARLAEARKTLIVFERTPEYGSRKALLEGLCESLVSNATPSLETAVKDRDIQKSQQYHEILSSIGSEAQFVKIWQRTRTEYWLSLWKSAKVENDSKGGSRGGLVDILPKLFDAFIDLLNEEKLFAPILFPGNPRQSIESLIATTFSELEPSIDSRLKDTIKSQDEKAINSVVEVHALLKYAISTITGILNSVRTTSNGSSIAKSPISLTKTQSYQYSPNALSPSREEKQLGNAPLSPQSPNATRPQKGSQHRKSSQKLSIPTTKSFGFMNDVFDDPSPQSSVFANKSSAIDIFFSELPYVSEWESAILEPMLKWQASSSAMERDYLLASRKAASQSNSAVIKQQQSKSNVEFIGSDLGKLLVDDTIIAKTLSEDALQRNIRLNFGLLGNEVVICCEDLLLEILNDFKHDLDSKSGEVIAYARRQAEGKRDELREEVTSSIEEHQWKSFEDGVFLLSSLHKTEDIISKIENNTVLHFKDTVDMILLAGTPLANEAASKICDIASKAPVAILAHHYDTRLHSIEFLEFLEKTRAMTKELKGPKNKTETTLFHEARLSLSKQIKSVQQHLIDVTLAPLLAHMEVYTQLSIWHASRLPGSVNEYELAMPTFSLSPTEEMSKIGEGLLNLPRLLEVWSDNESLRWAMQGLPFVATEEEKKVDASKSSDDVEISLSPTQANKRSSFHSTSVSISPNSERRQTLHRHSSSVAAIATQTSDSNNTSIVHPDVVVNNNVTMLQTYLSSIALSLVSHIVSLVLPSIIKLSTAGSLQLVADLEYLLNILSALNVNSVAIGAITTVNSANSQAVYLVRTLEAWKDSCKLKDSDGQRIMTHVRDGQMTRESTLNNIEEFQDDLERLQSLVGTQAFDMVAKMRGW